MLGPTAPGKFALLPTVGGQTALNLAVDLADAGILDRYNVELIGAKLEAIKKAEDRLLFKDAMHPHWSRCFEVGAGEQSSRRFGLCSEDRLSGADSSELYAGRIGRRHCATTAKS